MNEVLMETVIAKVENHEKKLEELEEKFSAEGAAAELLTQFTKAIDGFKDALHDLSFPAESMKDIKGRLILTNSLLQNPPEQKVVHHHHLKRSFWIGAALFLVIVGLSVLLFDARTQINQNIESDIKYRQLRLFPDKIMAAILRKTDSLYLANPEKLRKHVIQEENHRKEQAELLQQATEKETEARQLKEKAKSK